MARQILSAVHALLVASALVLCSDTGAQVVIDRRVTIQPIQVRSNTGTNAANADRILWEAEMDKIWSQAGIDVEFREWMTFDNSVFLDLASPDELYQLKTLGAQPWSMVVGTELSEPNVVRLFFVNTITSNAFGTSLQSTYHVSTQDPANPTLSINQERIMAIANNAFAANRIDSIAHELGHLLGLGESLQGDHKDGLGSGPDPLDLSQRFNLMTGGSNREIPSSLAEIFPDSFPASFSHDRLTSLQIDRVRAMPLSVSIPEPLHTAILAGASALLARLAGRHRPRAIRRENLTLAP